MAAEEYRSLIRIEDQTEFDRAREGLDGVPAVYQITRPDGSRRWLRASLHRPPDAPPGADECLGVAQDVTEEHEAKLALVRLNAELERRVAERTAELRAANEELDAFAYSIAHDLTGPLRSINGFAALLERDAGDRLDEESRSDLARIRKSSLRMASLISDLLQLSRLTRATVQRERVDLSSLAREVAEELGATQPDRRVEWRIRDGLLADADAGLARALLQNLLGNAWKYTRDRADPVIELGLAEAQPGSNEFFVRDNGAGFDMTGASRLFTPFQRLHSAEEFEGSGIGLATVQRIVRRHGGKVRAQGEVGRGATFYFTLPASA
jgi:light-regulated signal transduction histidine kinase (bacteriophytochrome)